MADMPSQAREDDETISAGGPRADRPKRRKFTAAYKREILEKYDRLAGTNEQGAFLRKEGLYHSHIQQWREARDRGTSGAPADRRPGRPAGGAVEADNERLREENERLAAELARMKAALDIVGKAHALLGMLSEGADSGKKPTR